jgi:hypothetical protein
MPSGLIPLNPDGTWGKNVTLQSYFTGPNQQVSLELNPFTNEAAAFDILRLVLLLVGQHEIAQEAGIVLPTVISKIIQVFGDEKDLIDLVQDFVLLIVSVARGDALQVHAEADAIVADLLKVVANLSELEVLGSILLNVVGKHINLNPLKVVLSILDAGRYLTDLVRSFGSYLFLNGNFPTITLKSVPDPTSPPTITPTPTHAATQPTWHVRLSQKIPSCNNPSGVTWEYLQRTGNTISCQSSGLLMQQKTGYFPEANINSAYGSYNSNKAIVKAHAHFINVNSSTYAGTDATIIVQTPPGSGCGGGLEFEIRPTGQGRVQNPCTQAILFTYAVAASTDYDMKVETDNGTISGYINGAKVWSAHDTQSGGVAGLMVIDFAWPTAQVLYTNFEIDQWS